MELLIGLILAALLGLIPAAIAHSKGRDGMVWWACGCLIFIVALPHALLMGRNVAELERRQVEEGSARRCPFCAETIKAEARVCRYCGRESAPKASGRWEDDPNVF